MTCLTRVLGVLAIGIPLLPCRALAQPEEQDDVAAQGDDVAVDEEASEVDTDSSPESHTESSDSGATQDDTIGDADDEQEIDDDVLLDGKGEDPGRPPPPGKAVIFGVVRDTEFNEPLIEASIEVLGTNVKGVTDENGRFRLELPPGTYSVRVSYELHKTQRIDGLVVGVGRLVRLDVQMVPDAAATEEFEIIEEADKTSLEGILLARQRATVVGDGIGRGEISKSTDRNAAQAARRVVGATVVGGRFVYVRGLGERYTNALINGVPLPSPEPDRAAVPLDLFPTGVLDSLTIAKTFTPDVPGDFAGGSVRIETREIPSGPVLQLSVRGGYNTNTTFRERLSSRGGDLDWLGVDDGTRALPDGFPAYSLRSQTKPNGEPITKDERAAAGLLLNSYMSAQRSGTPPDHSISIVGGNGWDLGQNRKFGFVASFGYGRSYTVRRDEILRLFNAARLEDDPRGFRPIRDYRVTTGNENVNWGGFASATYRFSPQHKLSLLGLRSTLADNRTQYVTGYHEGRDLDIHATRLGFVTRALNLGVLSGEHLFQDLGAAELDWNLVLSSATRDEPDRRDVVWGHGRQNPRPEYVFTEATESGRHFFSEQIEKQYGAGLDWTQPVGPRETKLKLGGLVSIRDRRFTSRNLAFKRGPESSGSSLLRCPPGQFDACNDALFVPENIGTVLELEENTLPQDSYDAELNVYAGYVMAELGIGERFRLVIGERVEHTRQTIDVAPPAEFLEGLPRTGAGAANPEARGASIRRTDLLPVVSGTWSPTKKTKVRASVTRTLARPQLRELAPFTFQDYFGGRVTSGNPDLQMTEITNVDTRLEHFPSLKDVLAFSVFFKDFRNPIEPVILAAGDEGSLTYDNARGAKLIGIELEARRNLEFLAPALRDFSVVSNLTLAHSRIELKSGGTVNMTNLSRPLVNQAPWVFNLALDYSRAASGVSGRILYNVVGPRVVEVGSGGLDDVYEHPRGILDVTAQKKFGESFSVKLEGRNLLNAEVLKTQGCGSDGLFGSTWRFSCSHGEREAVSRYTEGTSFAVSAGYDF